MKKAQYLFQSSVGPLYLVASERGLSGLFWKKQNFPLAQTLKRKGVEFKILAQSIHQLKEYFKGTRKHFDLPLDTLGTSFQERVWQEILKVPYASTLSYSDIAGRMKNSRAVRAVGSANGKNPLCIIIPCHRVIARNGTLGGYSGGLKVKTQLLNLEHKHAHPEWMK